MSKKSRKMRELLEYYKMTLQNDGHDTAIFKVKIEAKLERMGPKAQIKLREVQVAVTEEMMENISGQGGHQGDIIDNLQSLIYQLRYEIHCLKKGFFTWTPDSCTPFQKSINECMVLSNKSGYAGFGMYSDSPQATNYEPYIVLRPSYEKFVTLYEDDLILLLTAITEERERRDLSSLQVNDLPEEKLQKSGERARNADNDVEYPF